MMLKITIPLSIIILVLFNSCTENITTNLDSQLLQIEDSYIAYDSSGLLVARVEFVDGSPINELLSVRVEFQISEGITFQEELYDDGSNGDIESNNGIYNLEKDIPLDDSIYDVSFFAYTEVDTLIISDELVVGSYAPRINEVCIPAAIEIDQSDIQYTIIALPITDKNGINDIDSVKFKIRYFDGYCHHNDIEGECTCNCGHTINENESDEYEQDDDYILTYTSSEDDIIEVLENPDYTFQFGYECLDLFEEYDSDYIFSVMIPFSPYSCGGWGDIGFVFEVIDKSGLKFETEEYKLELFYPPGDCE